MNKSTKIWLNYVLGAVVSALLLWGIYVQLQRQLAALGPHHSWWHTGPQQYLWLCLLLMPLNIGLEARKWHLLANSAQPISYRVALLSFLAGIAISIVTPNRIGEYPGRIIYLRRKNTFRLISVSILGSFAQLFTLFIYGTIALIYYNVSFPSPWAKGILAGCGIFAIALGIVYWHFETWLPFMQKIKWMRRYHIYGLLMRRFSTKDKLNILGISLFRFLIFSAQYLALLRWMNVTVPILAGLCMVALFFWGMAVIPSIALAELGIRGQLGIFLFHHLSTNTLGILEATTGIWLINLIIPATIGSVLLFRMRLFR